MENGAGWGPKGFGQHHLGSCLGKWGAIESSTKFKGQVEGFLGAGIWGKLLLLRPCFQSAGFHGTQQVSAKQ